MPYNSYSNNLNNITKNQFINPLKRNSCNFQPPYVFNQEYYQIFINYKIKLDVDNYKKN